MKASTFQQETRETKKCRTETIEKYDEATKIGICERANRMRSLAVRKEKDFFVRSERET